MLAEPLRQLHVRSDKLGGQLRALPQEFHGGNEDGCQSVLLIDIHLAIGLLLQAGNPGLDSPHGVDATLLEKRELVGIGGRDDLHIATGQRDGEALLFAPGAGRDILGVTQLGRGEFAALEILRFGDAPVGLDDQGGAALGRTGEHTNLVAARADVRVERRVGADVRQVDRAGKNRLHGARAGIKRIPLHDDIRPEALLEPALSLARRVRSDDTLGMGDVGEIPDAQCNGGRMEADQAGQQQTE
ncbi:MAG: hypothetical protein BWX86_02760 [Verrucomicrobia bacterium ADurb.Bin122]|nr:MAG: hypothetical protein BWX86_02760 [Verrucomicrobia bacterium ADurb.Bin122]